MGISRFCRTAFTLSTFAIVLAGAHLVVSAPAQARQAAGAINLYQDALAHKGMVTKDAPPSTYSDSMCKIIGACSSDGSAPKYGALPAATIDGHKVGRAVYLVKTDNPKEPQAVVYEHQTATTFYFFRLNPDGSIMHIAYGETGQQWVPLATSLGQKVLEGDKSDWHTAFAKASAAPAAAKAPAQ